MKNSTFNCYGIILIIFIFLFSTENGYSISQERQKEIDSLQNVIKTSTNDGDIALAYKNLAKWKHSIEPENTPELLKQAKKYADLSKTLEVKSSVYETLAHFARVMESNKKSKYYLTKALNYADGIKDKSYLASFYNNVAYQYTLLNNADSARLFYDKTLKLKEDLGDELSVSKTLLNLGILNYNEGNYPLALENFFEALEIKQRLSPNDSSSISKLFTNIGNVYIRTGKYDRTLAYYKKSMKYKNEDDLVGLSKVTLNTGSLYKALEKPDSALKYLNEALALKTKLKDKQGIATTLSIIASVYKQQNKYEEAIRHNLQALEIHRQTGNQFGISGTLTNLGNVYVLLFQLDKAETVLLEAIEIAEEHNLSPVLKEAYQSISVVYSDKRDYKTALEYYKKYDLLKEKLVNEKNNKQIEALEQQYQRKQDREKLKRQEAEQKLLNTQLDGQKRVTAFAILIGILLLVILLLFIHQNRVRKRYNLELEEANKDLDRRVRVRTQELQTENDVRRKTESDLKNSEEKYRTVTETVNAGIAIADVNETIIFTNKGFLDMLGYTREELVGKTLDMIVSKETFEKFKEETKKRRAGSKNQYLIKMHRKNGEAIEALLSAAPLFDDNGRYVGGVASVIDISELKKAENSISNALQKSEKINALKNQFLQSTSEALRTPLNNILGMSEILKSNTEEPLAQEHQKLINSIYKSAEDIKFELLNIANLAHIEPKDIAVPHSNVKLLRTIDRVQEKLNTENHNIEIHKPDKEILVRADKKVLRQIIGSLTENALIHSDDNKVNIQVIRDDVKSTAQIEISNLGKPISRAELEKILDPFDDTKIENPGQREKTYDFSLVWIRKMLQIMNGRMEVQTTENKTTVVVTVPLVQPRKEEAEYSKLFNELTQKENPLMIFSNSEELDEIAASLKKNGLKAEISHDPAEFFKLNNIAKAIEPGSIILIDEKLNEPWTMEKTMLELKQHHITDVLIVAVLHNSCNEKPHLMEIGFHKCVKASSCINELTEYLKNNK